MAQLFDFQQIMNRYNTSESELESDTSAIKSDWYATGNDIYVAMKKYEQEKPSQIAGDTQYAI